MPPHVTSLNFDATPQNVGDELLNNGCVIIKHRASQTQMDDLRAELQPYLEDAPLGALNLRATPQDDAITCRLSLRPVEPWL